VQLTDVSLGRFVLKDGDAVEVLVSGKFTSAPCRPRLLWSFFASEEMASLHFEPPPVHGSVVVYHPDGHVSSTLPTYNVEQPPPAGLYVINATMPVLVNLRAEFIVGYQMRAESLKQVPE
jgi:hypothetical protein